MVLHSVLLLLLSRLFFLLLKCCPFEGGKLSKVIPAWSLPSTFQGQPTFELMVAMWIWHERDEHMFFFCLPIMYLKRIVLAKLSKSSSKDFEE